MRGRFTPLFKNHTFMAVFFACHLIPLLLTAWAVSFVNAAFPLLFLLVSSTMVLSLSDVRSTLPWAVTKSQIKPMLKTFCTAAVLFACLAFMGEFLFAFQPLVLGSTSEGSSVSLPGAENIAYALRLFAQAWFFAWWCALCARALKRNERGGFLTRFEQSPGTLSRVLDWVCFLGVLTWFGVMFALCMTQLFAGLYAVAGLTLDRLPTNLTLLLLLTGLIVNQGTQASARLEQKVFQEGKSLFYIFMCFVGLMLLCQGIVLLIQYMMPAESTALLTEFVPVAVQVADIERAWPLVMNGLSLFMVAPLSIFLGKQMHSKGAMLGLLAVPLLLIALIPTAFPVVAQAFWNWNPVLTFNLAPLTDNNLSYTVTVGGISWVLFVAGLVFFAQKGTFMQSLVEMTPEPRGRKLKRLNTFLASLFPFFLGICFLYQLMGVQGVSYLVSFYFPTVLVILFLLVTISWRARRSHSNGIFYIKG